MKRQQTTSSNFQQAGFVSIVVTLILMIVVSLIVLSAAQLSRREQRQALDRQLNTQAYYAAESGVNDAVEALSTTPALLGGEYTECTGAANPNNFASSVNASLTNTISGTISYSCLLVDPSPTTWEANVDKTSKAFPIRAKDSSQTIKSITIAWQDKDGSTSFGCGTTQTPVGGWPCGTGLMRFDMVSTESPTTRANLINRQMTGFLYPSAAGVPNITYAPSQLPTKPQINCSTGNTPRYCSARIDIPAGLQAAGKGYYLRLESFYSTSSVVVWADNTVGSGQKVELVGAQILVDSTGKASDILRRIQVRVPYTGVSFPDFGLQTNDTICKRIQSDGTNATPADADPACQF